MFANYLEDNKTLRWKQWLFLTVGLWVCALPSFFLSVFSTTNIYCLCNNEKVLRDCFNLKRKETIPLKVFRP